ncbi:MAG: hypothetical protein AAF597_21545, partial [Bacteroidota bacterium]
PREISKLRVDFRKNEYTYQGKTRFYKGGEWSGGRLVYFPYCLYNRVPRTPLWEAITLLLAGGFLLLGDDASTESIVDRRGRDLLATSNRAKQALQRNRSVKEYFMPIQPMDGAGLNPGQFLARREDGLADADFKHVIKGLRRNGKLEYLMKNQLREVDITGSLGRGELNTISYQDRQSINNLLTLASPTAKPLSIEFRNRLGVNGDYFRVVMQNVGLAARQDLQLNIKPAYGGVEIAGSGQQRNVPVLIETKIKDRIAKKTVQLNLQQPTRITPLSIGGTPELAVSRLDNLFGPRLNLDIL